MWYAWRRLAARPTNEMCAQFIMFAMMYALRERFPDLRLCKKAHIERKQKSRRLRDEDKPWLCLHTLLSDWESFLSHKEVIIAAITLERRKEIRGSSCWTLSLSIQLTLYNISIYLWYLSWSSRWLECRRHDDPSCARKSFVYFLNPCTTTENFLWSFMNAGNYYFIFVGQLGCA